CITVATTHYGEIKNFSDQHPDFENAAMEFKKETLEPLYKLNIGKTGDSNALYISKKMGILDNIIEKTRRYIESKNYNYELIKDSKINKKKDFEEESVEYYEFAVGDKVLWLDKNESAIVYREKDKYN
ncbi:endonuclease MutS2, partial [Clostridium perfringens]|nr:endonuclease MutS2 [Clostridium perfringens]